MHFTNFDVERFLRENWQKAPLLIRGAWSEWCNPLAPDELAGLACEAGIESRLVSQASGGWQLEHGPLPASRFGELGAAPWTLLVQAVDHHVPAVAALLAPFRFVPNWRVDDVMVSYATDGGGVGPHFDQYDVFLLQGLGRRRWQLGARCDAATPLMAHDELRLLARFEPTEEWILEPGDILYVPPGIAHNGIAAGDDCMTYSIGFRAPSRSELIEGWAAHLIDTLEDDDRYGDADLVRQRNPGEITAEALARLQGMIAEAVLEPEAFARWFGAFSTAPKSREIDWTAEMPVTVHEARSLAAQGIPVLRNPASRFSFVRLADGALMLFVDGQSFTCSGAAAMFAERLCAQDRFSCDEALLGEESTASLMAELLNRGSIAFEPAD